MYVSALRWEFYNIGMRVLISGRVALRKWCTSARGYFRSRSRQRASCNCNPADQTCRWEKKSWLHARAIRCRCCRRRCCCCYRYIVYVCVCARAVVYIFCGICTTHSYGEEMTRTTKSGARKAAARSRLSHTDCWAPAGTLAASHTRIHQHMSAREKEMWPRRANSSIWST